jgi:hypothetical protein
MSAWFRRGGLRSVLLECLSSGLVISNPQGPRIRRAGTNHPNDSFLFDKLTDEILHRRGAGERICTRCASRNDQCIKSVLSSERSFEPMTIRRDENVQQCDDVDRRGRRRE